MMDRGVRWLFWGFAISCFSKNARAGVAISVLVILYGTVLVEQARPTVPNLYARRSQGAGVLILIIGMVSVPSPVLRLLIIILELFAQLMRGQWLFLYLAESEALYGHNPQALHMQRGNVQKLYLTLIIVMALYDASLIAMWLNLEFVFILLQYLPFIGNVITFGTGAYQAWCMAQLRRSLGEPPMIPPG